MVVYKKLAFKKYKDIFIKAGEIISKKIEESDQKYLEISDKITNINEIAKLRFEG